MELLILVVLVLPPIVLPLWIAAWIAFALHGAVKPQVRIELAKAGAIGEDHLNRTLHLPRIFAHAPAALGAVLAGAILIGAMVMGIGGGGSEAATTRILALFGYSVGIATVLADRIISGSLWNSASAACRRGEGFPTILAIVVALFRAGGSILLAWGALWLVLSLIQWKMPKVARNQEVAFAIVTAISTLYLCRIAHGLQRRAWRRFVAGYLDVGPVADLPSAAS